MNEIKKAVFLLGLFLIMANMVFASGSSPSSFYSDELTAQSKFSTMQVNSTTNASFVGAWQWNYESGYQILVFTKDGTGLFHGYDKSGYKSFDGPSTFFYKSSTNEIVLYFPAYHVYRYYTYNSTSSGFRFTLSQSGVTINSDYVKLDLDALMPPPLLEYIIVIGNQQYGPYEMEQLRQLVQLGALTRDTLVRRDHTMQWAAAGTIKDLTGLFSAPPPSPQPLREPSLLPLLRPLTEPPLMPFPRTP